MTTILLIEGQGNRGITVSGGRRRGSQSLSFWFGSLSQRRSLASFTPPLRRVWTGPLHLLHHQASSLTCFPHMPFPMPPLLVLSFISESSRSSLLGFCPGPLSCLEGAASSSSPPSGNLSLALQIPSNSLLV